jgi:O-antigen ligase
MQNIFLYLYSFSLSFEGFQAFGVGYFSLPKLFALLYFFAALTRFKKFFGLNRNVSYIWPLFVYYVIFTLVSVYNINYFSQNIFSAEVFFNMVMFNLILNHARLDYLVLDRALISFSFGAAFVVMLMLLGVGSEVDAEGRVTFMQSGINELALKITGAVMVFVMLLTTGHKILRLGKFSIRKIYLIPLIPFMLHVVLSSGSRTATLVIFLSVFVWFLISLSGQEGFKFSGLVKSSLLLLAVLTIVFYLAWQSEVVVNRFFGGDGVSTKNLGGRAIIWASYYKLFLQNIFFGYGLSGFELESFKIFGAVQNPHNLLLEIMLYTGLIGLFVYLIFLSKISMAVYRLWVESKLLLPSLLFVVYLGFLFSIQASGEKFCWLVLAYIVGTKLWSPKARQFVKYDKETGKKSRVVFQQRAE